MLPSWAQYGRDGPIAGALGRDRAALDENTHKAGLVSHPNPLWQAMMAHYYRKQEEQKKLQETYEPKDWCPKFEPGG